ncbi:MAG: capreomycidine synthase [Alphaproteobacteria bacterium]|nr:capreomycidine synthase [Alphaproteobacteria bacterium]
MHLEKPLLEDWMRAFYFTTKYDIGSSGVKNFSLKELFNLIDLVPNDLGNIIFNDSETFGNYELRRCISQRWGDGDPSSVLVGNGSNEVIFLLLNSLLSKGDEVIVLRPIYHTLGKLAESLSCNVKEWALDSSNNFQPNLEDLRKLISSKTRMVIVNFPHNPSGVSITKDQLDELISIVSVESAYLIWDAAFEEIVFHDNPLPNPYLFYNKSVYIGTVSKSYGLAGLRLGWCISDPAIIKKCENMKDYTSLYVSPLNEFIGLHFIKNIEKITNNIIPRIKLNYRKLSSWLDDHNDKIGGCLPDGGVSTFLKIFGCKDTEDFCINLAKEKKTLLVPGKCFGYPEFVRLGFGASIQELEEGLNNLSQSIRFL